MSLYSLLVVGGDEGPGMALHYVRDCVLVRVFLNSDLINEKESKVKLTDFCGTNLFLQRKIVTELNS